MKRFLPVFLIGIVVAGLCGSAVAQKPAVDTQVTSASLFPLEDLRPGMKGTARTVFSGTKPDEFGVEILGVLPGFPGPRQSAIIARLSSRQEEAILHDAVWDEKFRVQLLRIIARRERWKGHGGDLIGSAGSAFIRWART